VKNLKVGDAVQLSSGGPYMTVISEGGGGIGIECKWFHEGKVERHFFPEEALVKIDPKDIPSAAQ